MTANAHWTNTLLDPERCVGARIPTPLNRSLFFFNADLDYSSYLHSYPAGCSPALCHVRIDDRDVEGTTDC